MFIKMEKNGPRYNRDGKEVDGADRVKNGGGEIPKRKLGDFQKVFDDLNPPRPGAAVAGGEGAAEGAVMAGAEEGAELLGPVGMIIGAGIALWDIHIHGWPHSPILCPGPGYPM